MPSTYEVVLWTKEYAKLFKNAIKRDCRFSDYLTEINSLLESECTFQFDNLSSYSSLFNIAQPDSPSKDASISEMPKSSASSTQFVRITYANRFSEHSDPILSQLSQREKKKRLEATLLFLDLWRFLLSVVENVPYNERKLIFKVISHLMKRREFDVSYFKTSSFYSEQYGSSSTPAAIEKESSTQVVSSQTLSVPTIRIDTRESSSSKYSQLPISSLSGLLKVLGGSSSEEAIIQFEDQVLTQFFELSYRTQEYVVKSVLISKQVTAIYEELFQFCAQVLAVNCFRLFSPRATELFAEQLCSKSLGSGFVSQETIDIIQRNIDGDETRKTSLINTPSIDSLNTLLNKRKQISQHFCSDDKNETDKSNQVVNRLFRCYHVFFSQKLQASKRVLSDEDERFLISTIQSAYIYLPKFENSHLFFFTFFAEFVKQISRLMNTESIDYWQYAPGYRCLLNHYVEIALRNVKNYMKKDLYPEPNSNYGQSPATWVGCSFVTMRNPVFLNVLLELFFRHTNAFNLDQVFFTLIWLESWFREMCIIQHSFQQFLLNNHRLYERYFHISDSSNRHLVKIYIGELPRNFDYDFF
jgi:hypothetical protein